jgi:hypothetical protein
MRLAQYQIENIRRVARRVLDEDVSVTLFGSRAFDCKKGGDIDLLFEIDAVLPNRAETLSSAWFADAGAWRAQNRHRKRLHSTLGYKSPTQFLNDWISTQHEEKSVA